MRQFGHADNSVTAASAVTQIRGRARWRRSSPVPLLRPLGQSPVPAHREPAAVAYGDRAARRPRARRLLTYARDAILGGVSYEAGWIEPEEVDDALRQWTGEVLGKIALDETTVSYNDLLEAVTATLIMTAETVEDALSPRTAYLAELFCSP